MDEAKFKRLTRGETKGPIASILRGGLNLARVGYATVTKLRNLAYDRGWLATHAAAVPVISVGNLTVGGTGKTPVVEYLAKRLRERQLRVAILSRGYGSEDGPNDEALLLEQNLPDVPHLQSRDRVAIAEIAVQELESEVLLLDDGFQHRRLRRDWDVVLLDATDPWGGGKQLPAGLLRESPSSLRRADFVLLTRVDLVDPPVLQDILHEIRRRAGAIPVARVRFTPRFLKRQGEEDRPANWLEEKRVFAFCGIGNPSGFWRTLERLGATIVEQRGFPDHYGYQREDVEELERWVASTSIDAVVTTQKDAVKIPIGSLAGRPLLSLRIEAEIVSGEESLLAALDRVATLR